MLIKITSNKKVVLTGGHAATTALATVEEIIKRRQGWVIYWIGAKSAFEGKKVPTIDSAAFVGKNVRSYHLITGKLQKKFSYWTIPSILKIPVGFIHAFSILIRIRPRAVLSFGGFVSFPVSFCAWLLRIPVVIHDQTAAVGRASRFSSFFAKYVAVSRSSSMKYFSDKKTILTGNPVMSQIWEIPVKLDTGDPPVIYITGGSRGSHTINNLVMATLEALLSKYHIIHQTGYLDFPKFNNIKHPHYEVYPMIDPIRIDGIYKRADIVVSRSGANTVSEIIAIKRPSILIPITWSSYDEQNKNALSAKKLGAVIILDENKVTPEEFLEAIAVLVRNYNKLVSQIISRESPDQDAAKKLVDIVAKCVN